MSLCMNPRCDGRTWLCGKCRKDFPSLAASLDEKKRSQKGSYGRNSRSGNYGTGTYSFQEGTFDGLPALKRFRDGKLEFFYGDNVHAEGFLEDHVGHGHAIIKNGKLIYKCPPGESEPVVDLGG